MEFIRKKLKRAEWWLTTGECCLITMVRIKSILSLLYSKVRCLDHVSWSPANAFLFPPTHIPRRPTLLCLWLDSTCGLCWLGLGMSSQMVMGKNIRVRANQSQNGLWGGITPAKHKIWIIFMNINLYILFQCLQYHCFHTSWTSPLLMSADFLLGAVNSAMTACVFESQR